MFTEISRRFRDFGSFSRRSDQLINRSEAAVIDVSSAADFQKGHILNARHVPLSQLDPGAKTLARLKKSRWSSTAKPGQQSGQAAAQLAKAGFPNVYVLSGGLASWHSENFPVTRGK